MSLLSHARQKVEGVLGTISQVRELDFPFQHAKDALKEIEEHFFALKKTLGTITEKNDRRTVETFCKSALQSIFRYLPIIGFVARSTEVSGPVEFHGPFLRLVRKAIGADAKLVISSDWDFSPYTYIFPELFNSHHLVMVGLPDSESDNALVTPTAGHELGHNIWEKQRLGDELQDDLVNAILTLISGKYWKQFSTEFSVSDPKQLTTDLFAVQAWENSYIWSMAQSEELFCDLVGLFCFRESYLHAFEYLLAPWGMVREERYPSTKNRISVLVEAAKANAIEVPKDFSSNFSADPTEPSLLLQISDEATKGFVPKLAAIASEIAAKRGLVPEPAEIPQIAADLKKCVPATGVRHFQNIISAGWLLRNDMDELWIADYPILRSEPERKLRILNELLLKSLEVYELEKLQGGPECSEAQQSLSY